MKASELKKLAESYNKPKDEISKDLLTVLKNAAIAGKFMVSVRELSLEDREILILNGYSIHINSEYIDQPYKIVWG